MHFKKDQFQEIKKTSSEVENRKDSILKSHSDLVKDRFDVYFLIDPVQFLSCYLLVFRRFDMYLGDFSSVLFWIGKKKIKTTVMFSRI